MQSQGRFFPDRSVTCKRSPARSETPLLHSGAPTSSRSIVCLETVVTTMRTRKSKRAHRARAAWFSRDIRPDWHASAVA